MSEPLISRLPSLDFFFELDSKPDIKPERISTIPSAYPTVLAILAKKLQANTAKKKLPPLLVGVSTMAIAEDLSRELKIWLGTERVSVLPPWETLPFERVSPSIASMGERLRILKELAEPTGSLEVVIAPVRALIQKIYPQSVECLDLIKGEDSVGLEGLVEWLANHGYRREPQVSARGEMAVRGGIVDVFASAPVVSTSESTSSRVLDTPLRVEFFGDTIESMRLFSLADQLAIEEIPSATIFSAREFLPNTKERAKAADLAETLDWGRDHWEKLARGETFDGMESWMGWLVESDMVTTELNGEIIKVWVQRKEMALNAERQISEEEDLAGALIETWGAKDLAEVPHLNTSFSRIEDTANWLLEDALLFESASKDISGKSLAGSSTGSGASSPSSPRAMGSTNGRVTAKSWKAVGKETIPELKNLLAEGYLVFITAYSRNSAHRLRSALLEAGLELPIVDDATTSVTKPVIKSPNTISTSTIIVAPLHHSCIFPEQKLAIMSEALLTQKKPTYLPEDDARQDSLTQDVTSKNAASTKGIGTRDSTRTSTPWQGELTAGAYVVHKNHGVGRYVGTETKTLGDLEREYLIIHYKGNDKLYVPAEQIGFLSLYSVGENPRLNSLGGAGWKKTQRKAKAEAEEIAKELVELYGERNALEGHAFSLDGAPQEDLAAKFPFLETPDQLEAIKQVSIDMEKPAPMDRLIYGDVGFGKTEVAIRAAFKAISEGKQVALLAPTTLLVNQHYQNFTERYGDFPVRVEMLSRFISTKQTKQILEDLGTGDVDLVIGTHRLFSADVKFFDLGLLIIDEEQRFGVSHKEKLKGAHKNVDILTLTATPIPRTLEMSLSGIRDFSLIRTPPLKRHPILTYVGAYDQLAVKEAIRRELLREGQVFFVHNRIANIAEVSRELQELVPSARIATAHGRMNEAQLEQIVLDFTEKKYDVLVCTTIIESGIDMPLVNTLVVNRAEMLGLGQLHQLRGRVGRSDTQAYAYLFTSPGAVITSEAEERLRTIGETTALGSGYQLAMRDLEIRGAGNLLGFGQSGHMVSVGYDLYCDLVAEAVSKIQGQKPPAPQKEVSMDLPVDARLPDDYVPAESLRLDAYKKLFSANVDDIESIGEEWRDRFGPIPPPAKTLLSMARLRLRCAELELENMSVIKRTAPQPATGGMARSSSRNKAGLSTAPIFIARMGPFGTQPIYYADSYDDAGSLYECSYNPQSLELTVELKNPENMAEELYQFLGSLKIDA